MSPEIADSSDLYAGYELVLPELQWECDAIFQEYGLFGSQEQILLGTVSPAATLIDGTETELLRQASIDAGIGAGVINYEKGFGLEKEEACSQSRDLTPNSFSLIDQTIPDTKIDRCNIQDGTNADHLLFQNAQLSNSASADLACMLSELKDCEVNMPRFEDDIYTPRWIRGIGKNKEGLCSVCFDNGMLNWRRMKCSAYWYHLNYFHGVSSLTGRPFPGPEATRTIQISGSRWRQQGLCHICKRWVEMDSSRKMQINVPEIYWWKHIQACIKRTWSS
ncbi:hypothetical protein LPJ64_001767 [Coemansia asiatica]|uniref:Transcription regulator Rua1 C-terminal domain-containing protein n=1 Tax=Coemansia asiatica TaxID=1052880 RepID=A0A9W8CKA9_9FUNG|nr:hypothetical protein LPJ64_001767 [Coemansia asiatica]